jgi:hypothetical protein
MSLIEDVQTYYKETSFPSPPIYDEWADVELVGEESLDELRWGTLKQWTLRRGDEYVAIKDVAPATENQGWGDYGEPTIYEVRPVEKVITTYVPV